MSGNHNPTPTRGSGTGEEASHLRESIAQTRAEMGGTIQELHGRLNPTVLKEQAMDQFHEAKETVKAEVKAEFHNAASSLRAEVRAELDEAKSKIREEFNEAKAAVREATIGKVENMVHSAQDTIRDTSSSIVDTIRANPIPAALAGVGLAWLFMNARSGKTRRATGLNQTPGFGEIGVYGGDPRGFVGDALHKVGQTAGSVAHSLQSTAGDVAHKASDLAHQARSTALSATHTAGDKIGQLAHTTQDAAANFAHGTQEMATNLVHGAGEQAVRLERRVESTYRENPLAVGAAVLALGTALGLAVPITRREEALMGDVRDQMFGKVQDFAHDALDKVQDTAKHVAEDASQALKEGATTQKMSSSAPPAHGYPKA